MEGWRARKKPVVITLKDLSSAEDTQCELEEETVLKKIVSPANLQTVLKPYFGMLATSNAGADIRSEGTKKHVSKCKYKGQKVKDV